MGHLRRLIESRPMLERMPDQSLLIGGAGEGAAHRRATRGRSYALIYSPDGAPFTVRLGVITGARLRASWFNPRTGETSFLETLENRGEHRFDPPGEAAIGNDWVLVLEDAGESANVRPRPVDGEAFQASPSGEQAPAEISMGGFEPTRAKAVPCASGFSAGVQSETSTINRTP